MGFCQIAGISLELRDPGSANALLVLEDKMNSAKAELQEMCINRQVAERQLLLARASLDEKIKRVVQGESIYEEFEVECRKLEELISEVTGEGSRLQRELLSVSTHLEEVKKKSGFSLWPKAILHPPATEIDCKPQYLIVNRCGWCKRGYHCYDIAVASCKHMFHPYCLGEVFKKSQSCVVCEQPIHPDWWLSWGFGASNKEMEIRGEEMKLNTVWASLKESLLQATSISTTSCKHFDSMTFC